MGEAQTVLDTQLADYKTQVEQLQQGLQQLEREYQAKREQGHATLNQLLGAVQALQILKATQEAPVQAVVAEPTTVSVEDALAEATPKA